MFVFFSSSTGCLSWDYGSFISVRVHFNMILYGLVDVIRDGMGWWIWGDGSTWSVHHWSEDHGHTPEIRWWIGEWFVTGKERESRPRRIQKEDPDEVQEVQKESRKNQEWSQERIKNEVKNEVISKKRKKDLDACKPRQPHTRLRSAKPKYPYSIPRWLIITWLFWLVLSDFLASSLGSLIMLIIWIMFVLLWFSPLNLPLALGRKLYLSLILYTILLLRLSFS